MTRPLNLNVDRSAKTPLAEQIRRGIATAIESGVLEPGARLPSWHDRTNARLFPMYVISIVHRARKRGQLARHTMAIRSAPAAAGFSAKTASIRPMGHLSMS